MRVGLAALMTVALAAGCAAPPPPKPAAAPPPAPPRAVVVLLQDADGRTGAITVSNAGGTQELTQAGQAVAVQSAGAAPSAPFAVSDADLKRVFGDALAAQPTPPVRFLLYFRESTDELVPDSRALLPDVIRTIRERRSADVGVIGHTDTVGDRQSNYRLGLRRAERVGQLLQTLGVDVAILYVSSHGKEDLLVRTADGVSEPRNRRVEVTVR